MSWVFETCKQKNRLVQLKPYIFPVSFVGLLSRVFTQRNPAGSMLKILLMLQKSGEKTTWDGAKTLQKEWDTN